MRAAGKNRDEMAVGQEELFGVKQRKASAGTNRTCSLKFIAISGLQPGVFLRTGFSELIRVNCSGFSKPLQ
jgi:hypothetical protein